MTDLIYCADGNKRFADTAVRYGFRYGAQLPNTVYHEPFFTDQNWKNPNREKYMAALSQYRPALATVLDLEREDQLEDVLSWADEAAAIVSEAVIIIPKEMSIIDRLPQTIQGKQVRLGYSVPTRFGGTCVPVWEFGRRPVHLLGGSPSEQLKLRAYLNVASADGNYSTKIAINYGKAWLNDLGWVNPADLNLYERGLGDVMYFSFELSCLNIKAAWQGCKASVRWATAADIDAIRKIARQYDNELGRVHKGALETGIKRRSLIVATYSDRVVGFCNFWARRDGWQTIYEIAVDRTYRDQNIGAGLLAAVPGPIQLKCTTDNPANAFYEKQGFKHAGIDQGKKRPLNIWKREPLR
jgi:N-acetylglutamate synthase-like GNAT family acetyltransferase